MAEAVRIKRHSFLMDTFCMEILEPVPHRYQEMAALRRLKGKYFTNTTT